VRRSQAGADETGGAIDAGERVAAEHEALAAENDALRRKVASLTETVDALLRKLADVEPSLRAAELLRQQAEVREEVARQREIDARVAAELTKAELIAARDELANQRASAQGAVNDHAAAQEKLVRAEAAHAQEAKILRAQLEQAEQRARKLDFEVTRMQAELADARVTVRIASENLDRYARASAELTERVDELEKVVEEQSLELGRRANVPG